MKITHIITTINRGGAENHLAKLIEKQVEAGQSVQCIYLKGDGYWHCHFEDLGCEVLDVRINNYLDFSKIIPIVKHINRYRPDILHLHMPPAELFGALASLFLNRKPIIIASKHNDELFGRNVFIDLLSKPIAKVFDGVIFISTAVEKYFLRKKLFQTKTTATIHYGVDWREYRVTKNFDKTSFFQKLKISAGEGLTFCSIARLTKQKRIDILIKGFSKFLATNNNASKLIIVGDGEERESLLSLATKLNISDQIFWIRFSEEIPEILFSADVFVLTSEYEGLGLVLLEAMAAQKPIIATNVSAIPEIVQHRKSGLLIEACNPDALAEAMEKMSDHKRRLEYGLLGLKTVKENFNSNKMHSKTAEFYRRVIEDNQ